MMKQKLLELWCRLVGHRWVDGPNLMVLRFYASPWGSKVNFCSRCGYREFPDES